MASKPQCFHLIAVGGNSEMSFAKGETSIRSMSESGRLQGMLIKNQPGFGSAVITCNYYAWTGTPRSNDSVLAMPPMHLNGANRVVRQEGDSGKDAKLIVVGWSNGGDTAFNAAKRIGAVRSVDALITLDPVSRISSTHWLPFCSQFAKPAGVKRWFHAHTTSWGPSYKAALRDEEPTLAGVTDMQKANQRLEETSAFSFGNIIAAAGGPWGDQPNADVNIGVAGNHGHTVTMLERIVGSSAYQRFLSDCRLAGA